MYPQIECTACCYRPWCNAGHQSNQIPLQLPPLRSSWLTLETKGFPGQQYTPSQFGAMVITSLRHHSCRVSGCAGFGYAVPRPYRSLTSLRAWHTDRTSTARYARCTSISCWIAHVHLMRDDAMRAERYDGAGLGRHSRYAVANGAKTLFSRTTFSRTARTALMMQRSFLRKARNCFRKVSSSRDSSCSSRQSSSCVKQDKRRPFSLSSPAAWISRYPK